MDAELTPDNPHLKQIDTLLVQLLRDRTPATDSDVRFVSHLADMVRIWAGIPILPPEEHEEATRDDSPTPQTWAERAEIAQGNAFLRRN
jgi:hypothetical protein